MSEAKLKKVLLHGNLSILIKRGIKLKNMDWVGKSDPYVIVHLDGNQLCRTKTIDNDLNPVWNHPLVLQLCASYRELKFVVYDEDDLQRDDLIGTLTIPCEAFVDGAKFDKVFDLEPAKTGQIELSIKFIGCDKISQSYEVPDVPFPARYGNKVFLYQKAHIGENHNIPLPIVVKPHFGVHSIKKMLKGNQKVIEVDEHVDSHYHPGNCWIDVTRALYHARKFIYITGWSVWTGLKLIRQDFPDDIPPEFAQLTLGEMLKQKAREGLRVLMLVWNEATSGFGWGGLMGTHDEETKQYFHGTGVHCKLVYRKGSNSSSEFIWTHHQKSIILDAPIDNNPDKRRIIAFVGGLDLTDGRYDTPQHSLFRTLKTVHENDFHQVWKGITSEYGPREPWHDIHSRIEGPIARDVLTNFQCRWKRQTKHEQELIDTSIGFITAEEEKEVFAHEPFKQWNVQFFRSIDSYSSIMLTEDNVEKSIQLAYIHHIRRAKHFLYIENQYFLGSAQAWLHGEGHNIHCTNLIPVEIAERIVSAIQKRKHFTAYILLPMYPEGIPEDNSVQEILNWQWHTIKMMYKKVHDALESEGVLGVQTVEDYLNFYCLGNRETLEGHQSAPGHEAFNDNQRPNQRKLLDTRRFMIYVHSKMMIVDDEYIILGSANINERSMAGDRDTEIAIGAYQPQYTASSSTLPRGDVHGFRLSIWAAHTGLNDPIFDNPQTPECARAVNEIANRNWELYSQKDVVDLPSQLMKYPIEVDDNGLLRNRPGYEFFPDTTARVSGGPTNLPNMLTL